MVNLPLSADTHTSQMAEAPTLSAVAIAKNEAEDLPGFIANLSGWVDEIIVVDDQSTDGTVAILRGGGSKLRWITRPMTEEDGFAGLRNIGIGLATGDWLLHLDCDERVPVTLRDEILDRIRNPDATAFRYRRLNFFLHRPLRHGGWASWNRPQLARRGHHRFEGRLHENCIISGGNAAIGQLSEPILHLNDGSFEERLRKSGQYVAMDSEREIAAGVRVTGVSILGSTIYEFLKRYLLQRGFLDGVPGLIAALHASTSAFRRKALVWDRQNRIERPEMEDLARNWFREGHAD